VRALRSSPTPWPEPPSARPASRQIGRCALDPRRVAAIHPTLDVRAISVVSPGRGRPPVPLRVPALPTWLGKRMAVRST
jgi:hypothetical protein